MINHEDLKTLVSALREAGVAKYVGPVTAFGDCVTLELGPAPVKPWTPSEPTKPAEPQAPEPLGDDGLTKEQQRQWYASTGG